MSGSVPTAAARLCPKGDGCALNNGAVHCKHCGRNWPPDETWAIPTNAVSPPTPDDPRVKTLRRLVLANKPVICECGHRKGEHTSRYSTPSGTGWCAHERCHCSRFRHAPAEYAPEDALDSFAAELSYTRLAFRGCQGWTDDQLDHYLAFPTVRARAAALAACSVAPPDGDTT